MNYLLGMVVGYIVHDAVQPTVVGNLLDKVSLPANMFVEVKSKPSTDVEPGA